MYLPVKTLKIHLFYMSKLYSIKCNAMMQAVILERHIRALEYVN
jgi:hypothetical protein